MLQDLLEDILVEIDEDMLSFGGVFTFDTTDVRFDTTTRTWDEV